jgi:3-dehydroquinate synthase
MMRDSWVVALGGGVIGDLAGFAAATYLRGIALLQIPTSLLAMADSSVGGKVGIDYGGVKNLIGAFHQPSLVLTSPGFLTTLPDPEYANGMAEVIKAALIGSPSLLQLLETEAEAIWKRDRSILEELLVESVTVKARIVEQDERESGIRQLLNLGHTFGHAFEAWGHFERLRHGEAVAIGLVAACQLSVLQGIASIGLRERIETLVRRYRLPTRLPGGRWEAIEPWLRFDKKAREAGGTFVLTKDIGDVSVQRQVPEASVREAAQYVFG